jgi:hypothetical protein
VAKELGSFGVADLERTATALYVTLKDTTLGDDKIEERALLINKLKPHISIENARLSLENGKGIREKAKSLVGIG